MRLRVASLGTVGFVGLIRLQALRGLTYGLARFPLLTVGGTQAFVGAGGAAPAVAGYAQVAAQVPQGAGAALGGFTNLAISNSVANTNVHNLTPLRAGLNANGSYFN